MNGYQLTKEKLHVVREWAADESWVEKEVYELDEEYLECVGDILAHPVFQSTDDYTQHGTTICKTHCIQVSYILSKICRSRGWDYRSTVRAGLLHDLFLYGWYTHARETREHFHGFTHPRKAMNNAVKYFEISEVEENPISRHMWPLMPVLPKYIEGYVVLYADKFCGLAEVGTNVKWWLFCSLMPKHLGRHTCLHESKYQECAVGFWQKVSGNQVLTSACLGWVIVQVLKMIIDVALNKSFTPECLVGSGGMSSSHSSTVCALVVSSGICHGVSSFEFVVSFVLATVVMYDAIGVRQETRKQAKLLSMIMEQNILKMDNKHFQQRLKEFVGHTSLQVSAGTILGIGIVLLVNLSYVQT